jgi:exopolysaccharide production protein ExoY
MYWLDQILAVPLFVALAPVVFCTAIVTWGLSRRSPFVAHRRVGQHGESFWMLKLRTMWAKTDEPREMRLVELVLDQPVANVKGAFDERVTSRFARFCRRYSIDELPQLWHVVRGEMALIGPRPITRLELTTHYGDAASEVLNLRPGLSGLWQVMGRSRLTYRQRRRLDVFLVRHFTVSLYLRTLWRTIPSAIRGADAW